MTRTATTENFPVASWLIARKHRRPIMAFYRFARTADDIADDVGLSPADKLAQLEAMRASLVGEAQTSPPAVALRDVLATRGMDARHPLALLEAFRRDATNPRIASWADLIGYCRVSAMPVGRFVLDVHGEDRATWPASDALCAALQIINHVQDCRDDYRDLNRIYIPADWLASGAVPVASLGGPRSPASLRIVLGRMVQATDDLLRDSSGFADLLHSRRLSLEVAVIHRLATSLNQRLHDRDPLRDKVHHGRLATLRLTIGAVIGQMLGASE